MSWAHLLLQDFTNYKRNFTMQLPRDFTKRGKSYTSLSSPSSYLLQSFLSNHSDPLNFLYPLQQPITGTCQSPAPANHRHLPITGTCQSPAPANHRHLPITGTCQSPAPANHRHPLITGTCELHVKKKNVEWLGRKKKRYKLTLINI